jgi:tRNA U34 5-methylaminomethyl-2-thiouridine-forming methyltransferase MnmC
VVGGEPAGVRPRREDTESRQPEGKESAAHPSWWASRGLRRGAVAMDGDSAPGVAAGALGSFSPGKTPMLAHRRGPGSACVPAGGPAVLSPARAGAARREAMRCGAALGKKVKKKKEERPTRWSHTSAKERKRKGRRLVGLRGLAA